MGAVSGRWLAVLTLAAACGGSVAPTGTAKPSTKRPPEQAPAPAPAEVAPDAAANAAQTPAATQDTPPAPPPSAPPGTTGIAPPAAAATGGAQPPERLEGGEISRATLLAVLSNGIGRFLQKVHAEPHLVAGRFVGWRLLSLFENEPAIHVGVLQPGDTVMRVNGQSIERPEQFKNVWDSMATQSELVLLVQRAGKRAEVRYRIVDAP